MLTPVPAVDWTLRVRLGWIADVALPVEPYIIRCRVCTCLVRSHQAAWYAAARVMPRQRAEGPSHLDCCAQVTLSYQRNKLHRGDMALLNCESFALDSQHD